LFSRWLCKLPAKLPAYGLGRELGQERGLGLRIEPGRERDVLLGKEPLRERSLLLAKKRAK